MFGCKCFNMSQTSICASVNILASICTKSLLKEKSQLGSHASVNASQYPHVKNSKSLFECHSKKTSLFSLLGEKKEINWVISYHITCSTHTVRLYSPVIFRLPHKGARNQKHIWSAKGLMQNYIKFYLCQVWRVTEKISWRWRGGTLQICRFLFPIILLLKRQ